MLKRFLKKEMSSRIPGSEPRLVQQAFKLYPKNIAVGLFCSVFMMLFSYLQFVLIRNNLSLWLSAVLVFSAAFASVAFLYTPFVISVHRARITMLWRGISRDVLSLALFWAIIYSALFATLFYLLKLSVEPQAVILILFIMLLFIIWQLMLFKVITIVFNATAEDRAEVSLRSLFLANKAQFIEVVLCSFGVLVFLPYLVEQFFLRKYGYTSDWPAELKAEFSQNTPILIMFFAYPLIVFFAYSCICNAFKTSA